MLQTSIVMSNFAIIGWDMTVYDFECRKEKNQLKRSRNERVTNIPAKKLQFENYHDTMDT